MQEIIEKMLAETGRKPTWPAVETSPRRVKVMAGNMVVAHADSPLLYIDYGRPPLLPTYYFRADQVEPGALVDGHQRDDGSTAWAVATPDGRISDGAWSHHDPTGDLAALEGMVTFNWWNELEWYEEAERVMGHARDPHKRVDVVEGDRHIEVSVDGTKLADSVRPLVLFETMLPTRFYLPADDVDMDLLEPSETVSYCPYKGYARHWSATIGGRTKNDVAWAYHRTVPENPRIKDLVCFYNESVDLVVDGELQARPVTPWSV